MTQNTDLKKLVKEFKSKADKIVSRMAKNRDELRALIDSYEDICESNGNAQRDLEDAIDKMSELI